MHLAQCSLTTDSSGMGEHVEDISEELKVQKYRVL